MEEAGLGIVEIKGEGGGLKVRIGPERPGPSFFP